MYDKSFCDTVIEAFEDADKLNITNHRNDEFRKDTQIEINPLGLSKKDKPKIMELRQTAIAPEFFDKLNECRDKYLEETGIRNVIGDTFFRNMLVQRTRADSFESYSSWHCESGSHNFSDRALVYTLYLNDDFEGGETEFKYQKYKEVPEAGNLVIFPAGFTHTHRGAMLITGTKYIVTGWMFFAQTIKE